jgi:type IV pilus assembly protein PilQ
MKRLLGISAIAASAIVIVQAPAAYSAPTEVVGVKVTPTSSGVAVELQTSLGDRPQVFSVSRGNSWVADVVNSKLKISGGSFRQDNPAPGIASVQVVPLDANSIRVIVTGTSATPSGQIAQRTTTGLAFNVGFAPGSVAQQPATTPTATAQAQTPQVSPAPRPSGVTGPAVQPNPGVSIDGQSTTLQRLDPVPPFLPRAIAPPVGDISIATLETSPTIVDLGSAQRIPRLVLRDAPAREVLSLLARAAGLNLAYTNVKSSAAGAAPAAGGATGEEGPKVTLDVENEPVQDVFNNVLRITGLQASRTGRTLLVGPDLPDDSKSIITRTFRLNQAKAETVGSFLSTQGATTLVPVTKISIQTIGEGDRKRDIEVREPGITSVEAKKGSADSGPVILKGLTVSVDSRLNSVTISGESRKLDLAGQMILRLDARQRQVAVNVKVLDINLSALTRAGSSFSFGVAGSRFLTQGGIGVFNFDTNNGGKATPGADFTLVADGVGAVPRGAFQSGSNQGLGSGAAFGFNVVKDFVAQLQATVNNGNAKILTDPTMVVQEGQTGEIQLTEEVVTKIEEETETVGLSTRTKLKVTKENAGLTLSVRMEKIDDNGFVSLQVSPSIKNIYDQFRLGANTFALLAERKVNSGTIRLRDNQSLILSGIISDQDRVSVQKVPILGDLPILGSLFRRTTRDSQRREVIVLLTPQIMDDSDRSTFGYAYVPGAEARRALDKK